MKRGPFLATLALLLCSCASVDPWPEAERSAWALVGGEGEPPRTIYIEDPSLYGAGVVDAWEREVYVLRTEDMLPADSFLCRGYALAKQIPFAHDFYLSWAADFDLSLADAVTAQCRQDLE